MATSIKCKLDEKIIDIDFAIEIKKKDPSAIFTCMECGHKVRPHLGGGHTSSHFEHYQRNENCSLSYNSKLYKYNPPSDSSEELSDFDNLVGEEAYYVRKHRTNQGLFREKMIKLWGACCVTGIQNQSFLIASHIKPWNKCTPEEKLDQNNGLLINASYDFLFDSFHLTFNNEGKGLLSRTGKEVAKYFGINENIKITRTLNIEQKKYLDYHRNEFKKRNTTA